MIKRVWRWCAVATLGAALVAPLVRAPFVQAEPAAAPELATVDQIKSAALQNLLEGKFDQTSQLLKQAADQGNDPAVEQMAEWLQQFEDQRAIFASERREQYGKAVAEVHTLLDAGYESYAIDAARTAYLLADDKESFHREPWVKELVARSTELADEAEQEEHWLKALRLYSDLGAIEPANPLWKDKLKTATRRIRLVGLYTPDELKQLQEKELSDRKPVDELLRPTTQPTTEDAEAPTTRPALTDLDLDDSFRVNWQDVLKGINMGMLQDALDDARNHYYRSVTYRDLMIGGIRGLKLVSSTGGLQAAFPGLADEAKRQQFDAVLDDLLRQAEMSTASTEMMLLRSSLRKIRAANAETVKLPEEVLVSEFADGAFSELDTFSSMIWPSDVEEFNKSTQGEFSGVGISIQTAEDGSLQVVSPLEDSPAYNAGIGAGDVIEKIDGKNAKGITLNQAVKTITGPPGTQVVLTVRSETGVVKDYNLTRQTIRVASVKGWRHIPGGGWDYFVDPSQRIGYLRLTNFTKTTSEELNDALADLKKNGAEGLILDLRYNPGGLLQAATEVSDKFLTNGTIVSTRADRETPNHRTEAVAQENDEEFRLPMVVLVNQYSASASEIVSGALKDLDRALVVGERTFGKGSVQMLFPLAGKQAFLKLTTSHYYLPSGRCIHREENSETWGVDPDMTIEMTPEQMKAAIEARQELDVLRNAVAAPPAEGTQQQMQDTNPAIRDAVKETVAAEDKKDPLASDPQLGAALLLLRMQLTGDTQLTRS